MFSNILSRCLYRTGAFQYRMSFSCHISVYKIERNVRSLGGRIIDSLYGKQKASDCYFTALLEGVLTEERKELRAGSRSARTEGFGGQSAAECSMTRLAVQ